MNDRVSNDCVCGNIVLLYIAIGIAILGIIFMVCCNQLITSALCFSISCMLWGYYTLSLPTYIIPNPNIGFYRDCSGLKSVVSSELHDGFFASTFIKKGESIMDASNKDYLIINDGIADLCPIYKANTDAEMYEAVNCFKNNYNKKRALSQDYINVRIVHSVEGSYVEAIRDIQPGEELLRVYGLAYWIKYINSYIANNNLTFKNTY